jgi:hypothetical protein
MQKFWAPRDFRVIGKKNNSLHLVLQASLKLKNSRGLITKLALIEEVNL